MNTQLQSSKKAEVLDDEVLLNPTYKKLTNQLKRFGQWIWNALTSEPELKIWQRQDRAGNVWYQVYDPKSGRTACLASEEEVRMWIEESFYRRNIPSDRLGNNLDWYRQQ
jgi:hypothetical protein